MVIISLRAINFVRPRACQYCSLFAFVERYVFLFGVRLEKMSCFANVRLYQFHVQKRVCKVFKILIV